MEQYFSNVEIPCITVNNVLDCPSEPVIFVKFRSTTGSSLELFYPISNSVDDLLNLFFREVGKPGLKNDIPNKLCFLYNAKQMKPGDKTTLKNFFKNDENPKVVVNDINNLLG